MGHNVVSSETRKHSPEHIIGVLDASTLAKPELYGGASLDGVDFVVVLRRADEARIYLAAKAPGEVEAHMQRFPGVHVITVDLSRQSREIDASLTLQFHRLFTESRAHC